MFRAEQSFKKDRIEPEQIPGVVREQLSRPEISSRIQPGMNIAITAGSREYCQCKCDYPRDC
ncbi:MAG: hypothetical protein ACLTA4_11930 [Clostridium sp.]